MGNRDLEKGMIEVARRDNKSKETIAFDNVVDHVAELLEEIQVNLFNRAKNYRDEHISEVNSFEEFKEVLNIKGGFISAHWDGTSETELKIKEETSATIRCIPLENKKESGSCIYSGKPSNQRVLFAKAY